MPDVDTDRERLLEKVAILERHVDHLMGQLYHLVDMVRMHKERSDHLQIQVSKLEICPEQLDEALKKVSNLREEIAGRKEVELELRRRLEVLESEHDRKREHIEDLERTLNGIWASPPRRFYRALRNTARLLLGRGAPAKDRRNDGGR